MPIAYPLVRKLLFQLPAEAVHEAAIGALSRLPTPVRGAISAALGSTDPRLRSTVFGVEFPNPIGLAAGFDKGATAFNGLGALGFGFVEIGTVTAHAQTGNPRPRLFRLPADGALLNRMGFNNPGAAAVADRLGNRRIDTVLGINLGKSKATPLEDAVGDYLASVDRLARFARYLVINVSSPNTPGLRELQDAEPLRQLLRAVVSRLQQSEASRPPVLLKVAPDLSNGQLEQATAIALEEGVSGIVAANTTIDRQGLRTPADRVEALGAGGISGRPVRPRAQEMVELIYRQTGGRLPVVGVGGIFDGPDAWARILGGASLVQLYTGFIYGGPAVAHRINRYILGRLEAEGFATLSDAVGSAVR